MSTVNLDISLLLRHFRGRVALTWLLVAVENILTALIPLFIGRAIDALLAGEPGALWEISLLLAGLIAVAVGRRAYDTRAYGTMRVWFGSMLFQRVHHLPVTRVNARLDMSREIVDFLEEHVPELLTSITQIIVSICILAYFDPRLGACAASLIVVLGLIYALFHRRFYRLNGHLNNQRERQIDVLQQLQQGSLITHLKRLRRFEIRLSDTEAMLYGTIYSAMFAFVLVNLWLAATIPAITAGAIFAILSYSWELVESGTTLPAVLQQWSRLTEIRQRLNDASQISSENACTE